MTKSSVWPMRIGARVDGEQGTPFTSAVLRGGSVGFAQPRWPEGTGHHGAALNGPTTGELARDLARGRNVLEAASIAAAQRLARRLRLQPGDVENLRTAVPVSAAEDEFALLARADSSVLLARRVRPPALDFRSSRSKPTA